MKRRFLLFQVFYQLVLISTTTFAQSYKPSFDDYLVSAYSGEQHIPGEYVLKGGVWRDEVGKAIAKPEINFAGRYFVGLHSCGAECRYFSMDDLASGESLNLLDMFAATDPPQSTSDGHSYITDLITRPNSRLIVAQYHVLLVDFGREECREKTFLLDEQKIQALTGTTKNCQSFKRTDRYDD